MFAIGNEEFSGPVERRVKCHKCDDFFPVKDSEMSKRWNNDTEQWEDGEVGTLQAFLTHDFRRGRIIPACLASEHHSVCNINGFLHIPLQDEEYDN